MIQAADLDVGSLKCIDKSERCSFCVLVQIVDNGLVDIPVGLFTRDD